MSTASLAASGEGAAVRIDRLFLGIALTATAVLVALVLLDQQPASAALILGGFALGVAFLKAEFSFTASWRRFLTRGEAGGLLGGLIVIAIGALAVVPVATLLPRYGGAIAPVGPSLVIGAFVFGIGMKLRHLITQGGDIQFFAFSDVFQGARGSCDFAEQLDLRIFFEVDQFDQRRQSRHQDQPGIIGIGDQQDARQCKIPDRNRVFRELRVEGPGGGNHWGNPLNSFGGKLAEP